MSSSYKSKNSSGLVQEAYERTRRWVLYSGLVVRDKKDENFGGVRSFYNVEREEYGFLYPEITGYFLSMIRFLFHYEKKFENNNSQFQREKGDLLEVAKGSYQWLEGVYRKYGAIVQGVLEDNKGNSKATDNHNAAHNQQKEVGKRQKVAYSFDTAICAKGVLDYYTISGDKNALYFAKELVSEWLLRGAIEEKSGQVRPFKDLETGKFKEATSSDDVWYKNYGCLHLKVAMPLLQLSKLESSNGGDNVLIKQMKSSALTICNRYIDFQRQDGSVVMFSKKHTYNTQVNMHTLCYALEGLIYAYYHTDNEEYLDSCKRALDWCTSKIDGKNGSIPLWFNSKVNSKASYPAAQLVRLFSIMSKAKKKDIDESGSGKEGIRRDYGASREAILSFLLSMNEKQDPDPKVSGGMYEEWSKSLLGIWKLKRKLISWSAMFALQAFAWYVDFDNLDFDTMVENLY